jgi:hypothetical protein
MFKITAAEKSFILKRRKVIANKPTEPSILNLSKKVGNKIFENRKGGIIEYALSLEGLENGANYVNKVPVHQPPTEAEGLKVANNALEYLKKKFHLPEETTVRSYIGYNKYSEKSTFFIILQFPVKYFRR